MSNKGYIYTIVSLIFGLLLLSVISLQYQAIRTTAELEPSKVRTDELHFFVESAKKDMTRAMAISGRRGAAYLVSFIVTTNKQGVNNAEEALAEMIMNGTAVNSSNPNQRFNITQMENHTMTGWLRKVNQTGEELHFDVNITPLSIEILPYDESHFLQIFNLSFDISDRKGLSKAEMCRYTNNNTQIYVLVAFDEVEDPLYPLKTNGHVTRKMIFGTNTYSDDNISVYEILGRGTYGNGTGGGKILDLHLITNPATLSTNITNLTNYVTPGAAVEYTVFVFNSSLGGLTSDAASVLSLSGGVINYYDSNLAGNGYPFVSNLSYINFTDKQYVVLRNGINHTIEYLYINDDIVNKSYYVDKNNTGPSFFDRLEGRLNYSEKYLNDTIKARTLLGMDPNTNIGIESFVNLTEFANYTLYTSGILDDFVGQSSADFKYFNNSQGYWVYGTPEWFRLDAQHLRDYYLTPYVYDRSYAGVWHFDEGGGTRIYDSSRISGYRAVPASSWVAGKHLTGFNAYSGNYLSFPHTNQLNVTGPITITAWVNLTTFGSGINRRPIVSKAQSILAPDSYALFFGTGQDLHFALGGVGSVSAATDMVTDKWYFVAGTYDNYTAKLFVNGTQVASTEPLTGEMFSNTGNLFIGLDLLSGNTFDGTIDEVKIYNRSLSDSEIMDQYIMYR
jgi:hypothetical protein